jgi:hypothetical protein
MFSLSSFVNGVPLPSRQEAREKKRKQRSSPSNNDRDEKEKDDESEKETERRSSFLPSDVFVRNVLDVVGFVVVVVDGAFKVPQVVAVVTAMALPMKDIHFIPSPLPLLGGFIRRRPADIIFADDDYSSFFFLCGWGVCFQVFFSAAWKAEGGGTIRSEKSQKSSLSAFQKRADRQTKSFHDDHIHTREFD